MGSIYFLVLCRRCDKSISDTLHVGKGSVERISVSGLSLEKVAWRLVGLSGVNFPRLLLFVF